MRVRINNNLNESENYFDDAYETDNHHWKNADNKKFMYTLGSKLLALSEIEDGNTNHYISEMSKDKQELLIKIGNLVYATDK